MTHLARVIRLDESDLNVFEHAAEVGEWAISGAFAYSNWTEADLTGKRRQGKGLVAGVQGCNDRDQAQQELVGKLPRQIVFQMEMPW